MRPLFAVVLLGVAGPAMADRLILAPTARKIPYGTVRLEHMFDQTMHGRSRTMLAAGLTDAIDAEIVFERGFGKGEVASMDLSYNIFPALTGIAPGLSVGVRDVMGKTRDGRAVYIASTTRIGLSGRYNGDTPLEISHGYAVGDHSGYFIGVLVPFRDSFRLLAEYDSHRINAGLEYKPIRTGSIRWIHRPGQSFWSIGLTQKW